MRISVVVIISALALMLNNVLENMESQSRRENKPPVSSPSCKKESLERLRCYQNLLDTHDSVIKELNGQNPFLLSSWDQTDVKNSPHAKEIESCRLKSSGTCSASIR